MDLNFHGDGFLMGWRWFGGGRWIFGGGRCVGGGGVTWQQESGRGGGSKQTDAAEQRHSWQFVVGKWSDVKINREKRGRGKNIQDIYMASGTRCMFPTKISGRQSQLLLESNQIAFEW